MQFNYTEYGFTASIQTKLTKFGRVDLADFGFGSDHGGQAEKSQYNKNNCKCLKFKIFVYFVAPHIGHLLPHVYLLPKFIPVRNSENTNIILIRQN